MDRSECTVIIVACKGYDPERYNATQTTREGHHHGFLEAGVSSLIVGHEQLLQTIQSLNPVVWLSFDDYHYLDDQILKALQGVIHFVQVNTWFDGMEEVHAKYNAPSPTIPDRTLWRILDSGATFVWGTTPEKYLGSYENWEKIGKQKVVGFPWACDTRRYFKEPWKKGDFSGTGVAFVGGYRPYKEPQYEQILWPYEDKLATFGYSEWPRCYRGGLGYHDERTLYQNATVCPTISEPQFIETGDTVERPFKILGSGGLTIFDCGPVYRELFGPDEALIPRNQSEYHDMMDRALGSFSFNELWRIRGYDAIMRKHTYAHRAVRILEILGL